MRRLVILSLLALSACGKSPARQTDLDRLDSQLAGNTVAADPALARSLHDQIMVDPQLVQSANDGAIRPPPRVDPGTMPPDALGAPKDTSRPADLRATPAAAPGCPDCKAARGALTLGALAERQSSRSVSACAPGLRYATAWATKLPPELPLYPDARIAEAAGNDAGGCVLRVVSFASVAPLARVSDWFYAHATRGGYAAEHHADGTDHVLGGTRGDAAFMLYLHPRADGGTDADLVSNAGR